MKIGVQGLYDFLNGYWFHAELPSWVWIILERGDKTSDFWAEHVNAAWEFDGVTYDEIRFNATKFAVMTLEEFYAQFVHEMVHVWHDHVSPVKPRGKGDYHDRTFADRLAQCGIEASQDGKPGGCRTGYGMNEYVRFIPAAVQTVLDDLVLPVVLRSGKNNKLVKGVEK